MEPGSKIRSSIEFVAQGHAVRIPVLMVRGGEPGPTLLVSAGVHGDEYEGVRTIFEVYDSLDASAMKGNFLAVPVMNPAAFWSISRTSPLDGANLARVFPGSETGSPTEAIAYHFDQHILPMADFYIDLHSGGVKCSMPTLVGYLESDKPAAVAAELFGTPVIWRHPNIPPGRTISAARDRGIPSLYAEARGAGRIDPDDLHYYRRGVINVMKHLGILCGTPEVLETIIRLDGDGNVDGSVSSRTRGFLMPGVKLLEPVMSGQVLGVLVDIDGAEIESFRSPCDGVVVLIHECPLVQPEEPLFLITRVL